MCHFNKDVATGDRGNIPGVEVAEPVHPLSDGAGTLLAVGGGAVLERPRVVQHQCAWQALAALLSCPTPSRGLGRLHPSLYFAGQLTGVAQLRDETEPTASAETVGEALQDASQQSLAISAAVGEDVVPARHAIERRRHWDKGRIRQDDIKAGGAPVGGLQCIAMKAFQAIEVICTGAVAACFLLLLLAPPSAASPIPIVAAVALHFAIHSSMHGRRGIADTGPIRGNIP
jgi:hypothetical protein